MKVSGWGRFPVLEGRLDAPRDEAALRAALARDASPVIARGAGRAYGDSAVAGGGAAGRTLSTRHLDRMLAFDPDTGQLVAEAGVLLGDVIAAFLPRGWFPAVTPGTRFVTLGGMVAADVHGKNHHRDGSFGNFVDWIEVMGADGAVTRARPGGALFESSLGGMGLLGVILRVALRLRRVESGWIQQRTIAAADLDETMAAFDASADATYSVAWIDCLARGAGRGRALLMLGEHAARDMLTTSVARRHPWGPPEGRGLRVPVDAPGWLLNGLTMGAFNRLYYAQGQRRMGTGLVGWRPFFYPLDAVLGWNRIYGRRGFVQFQCVLPPDTSRAGLAALLDAMAQAGQGAFLSVLKRLGPARAPFPAAAGQGLSFPMEGYTLAVDFPVNARSLALMERLDAITLAHGGRFYLAKDARMRAATLHRADARAARFHAMRAGAGLTRVFSSHQSERLNL